MSDAIRRKIEELEHEYARTQKNKATETHLGLLKAKVAKLKRELIEGGTSKGGGAGERGFEVSKSGDTRIGLVGWPSVGKSTLLTCLTGTFSEAASYEFTTLTAVPGNLQYRGAKIQVVDLPGIIEGARDGKGRGRQVIAAARTCNMLFIVLDAAKPMTYINKIAHELDGFGIRLNQTKPNITIKKKLKGGVSFSPFGHQSHLTREVVASVCREYKLQSVDVIVRGDYTVDQLIDAIEGNRKYIPALIVLNKIDSIAMEELEIISRIPNSVPISSSLRWGIDELLEQMWEKLSLIRIYTKPKGQVPDLNDPVILPASNPSVERFCIRIHKGLLAQFKYANVWGSSAKFQPQKVGRDHVLHDEDILQIVKRV